MSERYHPPTIRSNDPPYLHMRRGQSPTSSRRSAPYFEGRDVLFLDESEGIDQLLALVEKLVGNYNEDLADSMENLEKLLGETRDGRQPSQLKIDLAELIESVEGAAQEQVSYLVDMAKADALDLLGENRQALKLVDRHV